MRPLRLARLAAEAEGLRLRYAARRIGSRVLLGLIASGCLVGAAVLIHVAACFGVRQAGGEPAKP